MVGNFRMGFIFAFFGSQEPFMKIKPQNFCCPRAKRANRISIWLLQTIYPSQLQQNPVSECAFDGYRSSHPGNRSAMSA